ncbi:type II CRISPR RNA-guided endonuclease Cas9 [Methylolobus aquaticus]
MKYRLALDVGTSSIGLVAYQLDENGEPAGVCYHAARIFSEPLLPAKTEVVGQSKKAARGEALQQRRQVERKARRLRRIAHCLSLLGLDASSVPPDPGGQIHALRARAVSERVELPDLARVLLKLAKRRGYAGGFKLAALPAPEGKGAGKARPKADEEDTGVVKAGIEKLKAEMAACGAETVGQYLAWRMGSKGPGDVKLKEAGLYAHRDMLIDEFERIWRTQAHHHPVLDDPAVEHAFRDAIFFQRPLKSPAAMVGHCQLEPDLPRAPMAQPAAQAFRIEKQLADLRWGMGRVQEPLTRQQREVIRELLRDKAKTSFEAIYKALEKAGYPKPLGKGLNMDRASREELRGDRTRAAFRKMGLLEDWERLDGLTQRQIVNFVADLGSPEQLADRDWPKRFLGAKRTPRTFSQPFIGFVNAWIASGKFARLGAMDLDSGRSSYSVKALEKLTEIIREQGLNERDAIKEAYPEHFADKTLQAELPPPPETGNVVVDVALRQLNREIGRCLRTLGPPPDRSHRGIGKGNGSRPREAQ